MGEKNSTWLTPVPKQSLSKMVVEKIKEALINGDIKPGDFCLLKQNWPNLWV